MFLRMHYGKHINAHGSFQRLKHKCASLKAPLWVDGCMVNMLKTGKWRKTLSKPFPLPTELKIYIIMFLAWSGATSNDDKDVNMMSWASILPGNHMWGVLVHDNVMIPFSIPVNRVLQLLPQIFWIACICVMEWLKRKRPKSGKTCHRNVNA